MTVSSLATVRVTVKLRFLVPAVAFGERHVVDGHHRHRVVVDDRADALAVDDERAGRRQVDEEGLRAFVARVALDGDGRRSWSSRRGRRSACRWRWCSRSSAVAVPGRWRTARSRHGRSAADRLTVKTALVLPLLPSVTVTSPMETASSSLRIVPIALARRGAWRSTALLRLTKNVSSGSSSVSPWTATVIVLVSSPGLNVSVPLAES